LGQQLKIRKAGIPREHENKAKLRHYKALKKTSTVLPQVLEMCHHLQSLFYWQEDNLKR
jgi:hypothetical protein